MLKNIDYFIFLNRLVAQKTLWRYNNTAVEVVQIAHIFFQNDKNEVIIEKKNWTATSKEASFVVYS